MKRFQWILILCGLFLVLSCQRSPQFKRENEFGRNDSTTGFYDPRSSGQNLIKKAEAMGQPKKKIVVLDFWNDTPIKQAQLGAYAAEEIRRGLSLSQRVILPADAKTDLGTTDFIQGSDVKVAQLIREGRRLGVGVLMIGRVSRIVFRQKGDEIGVFRQKQSLVAVELEAKLFDVQGGREVLSTVKTGEASSNTVTMTESGNIESPAYRAELTKYAVREAVSGFIPDVLKAAEKMAWQGRIAKILGRKIYVNAGRASGLIGGDILRVINPGDDVYDPVTGAYLGRSQGLLKGTLEVVDFIGPDGAAVEVHTGANFKEGDLVQLY